METDVQIDRSGVESGEPLFIEEIQERADAGDDLNEKSVCVVGRLSLYDAVSCEAKLTDSQTNTSLCVDTTLIEPFGAKIGSLFQMIGELESRYAAQVMVLETQMMVLKPRVVKCVDMMDAAMYRKAIQHQRAYLATRLE